MYDFRITDLSCIFNKKRTKSFDTIPHNPPPIFDTKIFWPNQNAFQPICPALWADGFSGSWQSASLGPWQSVSPVCASPHLPVRGSPHHRFVPVRISRSVAVRIAGLCQSASPSPWQSAFPCSRKSAKSSANVRTYLYAHSRSIFFPIISGSGSIKFFKRIAEAACIGVPHSLCNLRHRKSGFGEHLPGLTHA